MVLAGSFGCALANGRLRCWGNNLFNVDGAVSMHPQAVEVPSWRGVAQLSARTEDLCGVREGRVSCQGVNRRDHLRVPTTEAAMYKMWQSQLGQRIANAALDLIGPDAALKPDQPEAPVNGRYERSYRYTVVDTIGGGTSEVQKNIIARRALGLPKNF